MFNIVEYQTSCRPVSYTHLDVYKRQIYLCPEKQDSSISTCMLGPPVICGLLFIMMCSQTSCNLKSHSATVLWLLSSQNVTVVYCLDNMDNT